MIELVRFGICAALILSGLFILVVGVIGVFRFQYALNRMHAAALNDTLGILCVLSGLIVAQGLDFVALKLVLVIVFLWVSSPVASHLIARLEYATNENILQDMEANR